jgi:hypothetical protein
MEPRTQRSGTSTETLFALLLPLGITAVVLLVVLFADDFGNMLG